MRRTLAVLPLRLRVAAVVLVLVVVGCGGEPSVSRAAGPGAAAVEVGGDQGTVRAPSVAGGGGEIVGQVDTIVLDRLGEVDVRVVAGRRMELIEVREHPGWSHRVDEVEHDEIEFTFIYGEGRRVEVELELERGRVRVSAG